MPEFDGCVQCFRFEQSIINNTDCFAIRESIINPQAVSFFATNASDPLTGLPQRQTPRVVMT
jgi:hypothetical protein